MIMSFGVKEANMMLTHDISVFHKFLSLCEMGNMLFRYKDIVFD